MPRFSALRGMRDLLPEDVYKRDLVLGAVRKLIKAYGYEVVDTPTLESFDLISTKIGEEIRHRMYIFDDLGGRKVALRPEVTTSIARIVATTLRSAPKPLRLAYVANCFRYDNPQMGRFREFCQAGFELLGSSHSEADSEILSISNNFMRELGFRDYRLMVGHIGILRGVLKESGLSEEQQNLLFELIDKGKQSEALAYLKDISAPERCISAIKGLFSAKGSDLGRVLSEGKTAIRDFESSRRALENLAEIVGLLGGVSLDLNLGLARGLEYYTGMIFEVYVPSLGIALEGGGRYDNLVELFGGDKCPAVGCSIGVDRVVMAAESQKLFKPYDVDKKSIYVVCLDVSLNRAAIDLANRLRDEGFRTRLDVMRKGVKKMLSQISERGVPIAILVTPSELKEGKFVVKFMDKGTQEVMSLEETIAALKEQFR